MWDAIVLIPDYCLSIYFVLVAVSANIQAGLFIHISGASSFDVFPDRVVAVIRKIIYC